MKTLDLESIKEVISDVLEDKIEFCFLLGTAATNFFREDSDIDIAVFWKDPKLEFTSKLNFTNELQDRFARDVDLISLNDVDVIYGMQVMEKGRLLLNHNSGLLLSWKSEQLSRYPDFKTSRAIIEKNILNRKKYV